jgi:hypothetical protein
MVRCESANQLPTVAPRELYKFVVLHFLLQCSKLGADLPYGLSADQDNIMFRMSNSLTGFTSA